MFEEKQADDTGKSVADDIAEFRGTEKKEEEKSEDKISDEAKKAHKKAEEEKLAKEEQEKLEKEELEAKEKEEQDALRKEEDKGKKEGDKEKDDKEEKERVIPEEELSLIEKHEKEKAELRAEIEKLAGGGDGEKPLTDEAYPEEKLPDPKTVYEFISVENVAKLRDPETSDADFMSVLNAMASASAHKAVEETYLRLPFTAKRLAKRLIAGNTLMETFYRNNPKLADHKNLCMRVLNDISGKEPEMPFKELFEKTAEESYRRLRLEKDAEKKVEKRKLTRTPGGSTVKKPPAPKLEGTAAEIQELHDQLENL